MFEELKKHKSIVITGPQRAGTRITAKMIAHDTGFEYIDEEAVSVSDFRLLEWYLAKGNVVVHCPGLCHKVHELQDDYLVVIVRRPIDQIVASQKRINWSGSADEKIELRKYGHTSGTIAQTKYGYWDEHQKDKIKNTLEVGYESLKDHSLFVTPDKRKEFEWNQTR